MVRHRKNISIPERFFYILNYTFLLLFSIATIYPFINVIATSLSSSSAIIAGKVVLWPVEFTTSAYVNIIKDGQLLVAFKNTAILTFVGTIINMGATVIAAYPMSKKTLPGRKTIMFLMLFTMLFGGGLIPSFLLIKSLGMLNSYTSLWIPGMLSVYNMIILRTFFQTLPESLSEAAEIDGANDIYILFRIILPLSMPILATLTLFYSVGWWNMYFSVMIFITSSGTVGYAMIQYLPTNIEYTVITNSVDSALLLKKFDNIQVYMVGGKMRPNGRIVDSFAQEFVRNMRFDLSFLTGAGFTADFGTSNGTPETVAYQRLIAESSRKNIALFPSEKIGHNSFLKDIDSKKFDVLITDWDANEDELMKFEEIGINVQIVEKE